MKRPIGRAEKVFGAVLASFLLALLALFTLMPPEHRFVCFKFGPKAIKLDGTAQILNRQGCFTFSPSRGPHLLEYEKPDAISVRAELYPDLREDNDVSLIVSLDGITGHPDHKVVSVRSNDHRQDR